MGLFTRGHVYLNQDRDVYLQYDRGTGRLNVVVGNVIVGYMTSTGVVWNVSIINVLDQAFSGNVQLGDAITDTIGFYGKTPVTQPASSAQGAVATGAVTAVVGTATSTNGFMFTQSGQLNNIITSVNAVITAADNVGTLANSIRNALVQTSGVGLIKGAA